MRHQADRSSGRVARIRKFVEVDFSLRRRNGAASPGTRLRAHSHRRGCPRARPLPLQRAAPLRVSLFARTRPRRSQLRHRQEPGRVRIRVAVRAPARAPPPAAARGPAEGYFTRANLSAAVPGAHPPQSGAPGFALSHLSAASPGHAFTPLSATGLGFGQAGNPPGICINLS